jgi:hypothetical protein
MRIIFQPLHDTDPLDSGSHDRPMSFREILMGEDSKTGAHITASVTTADLGPPRDEDRTECRVLLQDRIHQDLVTGFEDTQRDPAVRKDDRTEREHPQPVGDRTQEGLGRTANLSRLATSLLRNTTKE